MSSTSGMTGTGLKKCIPTNRARRSARTASARRWIAIELVFEAKSALGGAIASSECQRPCLTPRSSNTASMTMSAPAARAEVGRRLDPAERGIPFGRIEAALVDGPLEVARDPLATGLRPRQLGLVEGHVLADRGVDLGDAVAHQARPGDEDALDAHATRVSVAPRPSGRARPRSMGQSASRASSVSAAA